MKNSKELILSWYGSHNSCVVMYYDEKYYVVELERFLNSKNVGLCNYMPCHNIQLVYDAVTNYLLSQTDRSDVDVYMTGYINNQYIKPKFNYKNTVSVDHHLAHAACTFFQSPYKEALVITMDGGGDNSFFNIYKAYRNKDFELIDKFQDDLGFAYMILSDYLADIKKESLTIGNLVYAGKLMGLCSYGKPRPEWDAAFDSFYDSFVYSGSSYIGGAETRFSAVTALMKAIGITDFDFENTRFEGELAWDIAHNSQLGFERKFYRNARKYLDQYPDLPLCLAGGCALNVLLNTKLAKERNGKVFIPPNTNDCGIAAGQLLYYLKPENQVDLTYTGLPMMDINELPMYLEDRQYSTIQNISLEDLASYINQGHIVGFIQGNSEHGSRALGNRSILCNPGIKGMKDTLNNKVKHREYYRPFAPMVKLENTSKYFNFYGEDSRHMTFVADVKEEWKEKLAAITHEDGTGRLQTITRWQNEAIYDLLTEFEKVAGHGVILNTSFNDNGKPILTRFSDALNLLKNTKLDAVYYHERKLIIFKNGEEKRFRKSLEAEGISPVTLDTTVNLLAFTHSDSVLENSYIPLIQKISKKYDRIVVGCETKHNKLLVDKFANTPNVRIYNVGSNRHYQNTLIHGKTKNMDLSAGIDKNSSYFFSLFIRPFWCKELMTENLHNTKYHLFIDLENVVANEGMYNYDVVRDVKMLVEFAKIEDDDIVGITGIKDAESKVFDNEFLKKKFEGLVPEFYPTPMMFYGNMEGLEWFFNYYEAMLLWYMNQDKVGTIQDYMLMIYAENQHKIKFLELEEKENE